MSNRVLPELQRHASKYSRGMVVVVAGSQRFPGAAVLAVGGARRGGAGYVRLVCSEPFVRELVLQRFPDVVVSEGLDPDALRSATAFVVGCGTNADDTAVQAALHHCLRTDAPVVIDAGMLDHLAHDPSTQQQVQSRMAPVVITPHEGEAGRMGVDWTRTFEAPAVLGKDGDDVDFVHAPDAIARSRAAVDLAQRFGTVTVLKGAGTVVATAQAVVSVDAIAGPELATAGTGDVLAGLLGSMLASHQATSPQAAADVAAGAVRAHAYAGAYATARLTPVTAVDVMELLPYALKELTEQERR